VVKRLLAISLLAAACGAPQKGGGATAGPGKERTSPGVGVTVYNGGYAIVKEWRPLKLDAALNTIRFTDVAGQIDATSVHFKSVTDPQGTTVLEQSFEYDLISADKILQKHIDHPVTLVLKDGQEVKGRLLSFDYQQITLATDDAAAPVQIVQRYPYLRNLKFAELPGGLITKPTLVWLLHAAKAGEQLVKVTYETAGMSWSSDYTAVIAPGDKAIDLSGWVTINNNSGGSYKDAELKLVAGDVNRAPVTTTARTRGYAEKAAEMEDDEAQGFVEKSFFEYHLYTLGRATTIPDASVKQIELFPPVGAVPAKKIYFYFGGYDWGGYGGLYTDRDYGDTGNKKVDVYLEMKNDKPSGLGIPLPAGRIRVYKKDEADGSLELIGEDHIDHTPRDEQIRLKLGSAFDVVGERKQTDFKANYDGHEVIESFEVKIRNHKDEDIDVIVKEVMYRAVNWQITTQSHNGEKKDSRTVHYPLKVPKNGETVLTYTVKYTW
jgi:hypothetical protein